MMELQEIRRKQNLLRHDYAHGKISAHEYDLKMGELTQVLEKNQPLVKQGVVRDD